MERGKKGAEKRGKGVGCRQTFTLPAKWKEEEYKCRNKTRLQFSRPGKMKYKTQKAVKETLVMRGMEKCLHDNLASASSSEESQTEDQNLCQAVKVKKRKNPK